MTIEVVLFEMTFNSITISQTTHKRISIIQNYNLFNINQSNTSQQNKFHSK